MSKIIKNLVLSTQTSNSCVDSTLSKTLADKSEFAKRVCQLKFGFDNPPEFYTKDDFQQLINTFTESIVYLYDEIEKLK